MAVSQAATCEPSPRVVAPIAALAMPHGFDKLPWPYDRTAISLRSRQDVFLGYELRGDHSPGAHTVWRFGAPDGAAGVDDRVHAAGFATLRRRVTLGRWAD